MSRLSPIFISALLSLGLSACGGSSGETSPSPEPTPETTPTPDSTPTPIPDTRQEDVFTSWVINTTNESSLFIDGGITLVNVQSVEAETIDTVEYAAVTASGIPSYQVTMSEGLIDWLNNRPLASSRPDFDNAQTTAIVGEVYDFGADLGYVNDQCSEGQGQGYWPPGPACPSDVTRTGYFPVSPSTATTGDDLGANTVGFAVNGVSIFGWYDGQSYNNERVWENLASIAEAYDVDICGGHAAGTNYHHHHYSDCWARVAGEDSIGHSELYGYAADGYPIYGPYQDTNVLAKSCWIKRNYAVASNVEGYGCVGDSGAIAGERSCVLIDPYNPSAGVESASSSGPNTSQTVSSLSGNTFITSSGFYKQDYYYDSACSELGVEYLDSHNGHRDDIHGYHYHLTIASIPEGDDVPVEAVYPFTFGPSFAGELSDNSLASGATGGPGDGGPPPR